MLHPLDNAERCVTYSCLHLCDSLVEPRTTNRALADLITSNAANLLD